MKDNNFNKIVALAWEEVKVLIENQSRYSHPYRNRFEHTKRVLNWAKRIQAKEGGDLEIITLAVVFHDTGWDGQKDHALIGAEHARQFLLSQGVKAEILNRVRSAIETHNKRQNPQSKLPIENLIVMDADRLDELGVTTLVWDAMATALEDDPSFKKALARSQHFFAIAKDEINLQQTKTGRKLYKERIKIWEQCLTHFRYELGESHSIAT
jgi:uncharacterized protein